MRLISKLTPRMISNFCRIRIAPVLSPRETEWLRDYLLELLKRREFPPYDRHLIDCKMIADASGLDEKRLERVRAHMRLMPDEER